MTLPLVLKLISKPKGLEKFLINQGYKRIDNKSHPKEFIDFRKIDALGPYVYVDLTPILRDPIIATLIKIQYAKDRHQLREAYNLARNILLNFNSYFYDPETGIEMSSEEYRSYNT